MASENSKDPVIPAKPQPRRIPLTKIHDLPGIFIQKVPDKNYGGLVSSIQASGVKEAVILRRREDGEYQLVDGYRRRRASELAKLQDIPAFVYEMSLQEAIAYHKQAKVKADTPVPGKLVEPQEKGAEPAKVPVAENTDKKTAAGDKPKEPDKLAEPAKPTAVEPKEVAKIEEQGKEPEKKAEPEKEAAATPKVPEKAEPIKVGEKQNTSAAPMEKPVAAPKTATPAKGEKEKASPIVAGPAAKGPAGTAISQVFEERLAPPSEKDLKTLPVPKDGESFFIILHPGYLEKSEYNRFSVNKSSENYKELRKSIEQAGIHDPVLTRHKPGGGLEILSGQRRHMVALELNYPVPAIIQKIDDADAKIIVADGNLHRDKISTYDLSRALRMKMEGMKQKAGRKKKSELTAEAMNSDEKLAAEMGMSVSKLNRILRLSEAAKEVCDRVDDGTLALSIASSISFLKPGNQEEVMHLMDLGYKVSTERVEYLKKVEKAGKLNEQSMREVLNGKNILEPPKPVVTPTVLPKVPENQATTPSVAAPMVASEPLHATGSPTPVAVVPPAPISPNTKTATEPDVAHPTTVSETAGMEHSSDVVPFPVREVLSAKRAQERPEYTKIILTGDRLRKYFPDVTMTPREIEESVYDALEERRQRQEKSKQKEAIFKKPGATR